MHLYPWLPFSLPITPLSLSCAQLDLSYNELGPEGAAALAPAIAVSASMTRLDVSRNRLDEEGKAVLREAIEGYLGFELAL